MLIVVAAGQRIRPARPSRLFRGSGPLLELLFYLFSFFGFPFLCQFRARAMFLSAGEALYCAYALTYDGHSICWICVAAGGCIRLGFGASASIVVGYLSFSGGYPLLREFVRALFARR